MATSTCETHHLLVQARSFQFGDDFLGHNIWSPWDILLYVLVFWYLNISIPVLQMYSMDVKVFNTKTHLQSSCFTVPLVYSCISILIRRLPKLPSQFYSNGSGTLGNMGSNKEISPIYGTRTIHKYFHFFLPDCRCNKIKGDMRQKYNAWAKNRSLNRLI